MARKRDVRGAAISAASDLRAASKAGEGDRHAETGGDLTGQVDRHPVGSSLVPWARTGLPRLMDARSAPVGARSATTPGSVTGCSFGDEATQTQDLEPVNSQLGPNAAEGQPL